MSHVPTGWQFVLLALAAFRVTRLVGWDDITDKLRHKLLSKPVMITRTVGGEPTRSRTPVPDRVWRTNVVARMVRCPWCLGWWVCLAWWAAWIVWPHGTLIAATPWALAALVGLVSKNLDP